MCKLYEKGNDLTQKLGQLLSRRMERDMIGEVQRGVSKMLGMV